MKRGLCLVLALVFLLCACSRTPKTEESTGESSQQTESQTSKEESSKPESSESTENSETPENPDSAEEPDLLIETRKSTHPADYQDLYEKLMNAESGYGYYGWDEEEVWEEDAAEAEESSAIEAPVSEEKGASNEAPREGSGSDYSETNVQVAGIDEGDIVKTDGQYIYVIHDYSMLRIFKVNGKDVEQVSETPATLGAKSWSDAIELYVSGDRLAFVSYGSAKVPDDNLDYGNTDVIRVQLFDITDRARPVRLTTMEQNGYFSQSRLIGDKLYMVSTYYVYRYYMDQNRPETFVPRYYVNGEPYVLAVEDIICPEEITNDSYTVMGVYDLTEGKVQQMQSIVGRTDTIYMNANSLYLARSEYKDRVVSTYTESVYTVELHRSGDYTTINRFDVGEDGNLTYVADGEVAGSIYGQFALDEKDGYLRVVTTGSYDEYRDYVDEEYDFHNRVWNDSLWVDNRQSNNLIILDENMEKVGSLNRLAPGERVYSVRYNGDIAYFCTFRQVDPLFCVDVSYPTAPKQLSALKIPGFSEYLHVYSDGRLFGLGQEANPNSGSTEGLKLTMFDTSDPENVTVLHTTYPDGWYSSAEYNHKAILVDARKDLIGFCAGGTYVIYGYSDTDGFTLKAEINLDYWGDARGLYIDNYFYIVDAYRISVIDLTTLQLVNTLEIIED